MHIIRINPKKPEPRIIRLAADILKRGGLVVYPTETAYALGCDASNKKAMRRVYAIKGREKGKPLPLIVGSLATARRHARFDAHSLALAKKFWPGPLTIVLGPAEAMRVSAHPVARAIAAALGRPVVSTSANRSGASTKYDTREVLADLGTMPDLVLDAGALPKRKPSTIVHCYADGCEIIRQGPVSTKAILQALCDATGSTS